MEDQLETANPFKGEPSPEMDDAWNKLLGPTAVRVGKEVLDKINRSSVALTDGSGYMVTLDVYHQLHCLVSEFLVLTMHLRRTNGVRVAAEICQEIYAQRLLQYD